MYHQIFWVSLYQIWQWCSIYLVLKTSLGQYFPKKYMLNYSVIFDFVSQSKHFLHALQQKYHKMYCISWYVQEISRYKANNLLTAGLESLDLSMPKRLFEKTKDPNKIVVLKEKKIRFFNVRATITLCQMTTWTLPSHWYICMFGRISEAFQKQFPFEQVDIIQL